MRLCYRCLLWLHPPMFRREFSNEMLWIYDQAARTEGAMSLFFDGVGSLTRQWVLRSRWWKIALALSLAVLQIVLGGFSAVIFGHRHLEAPARDPSVVNMAEFAHYGAIAHQPLTVGIVMYLAVFITGGLTIMVIGLAFWMRHCARRVR